ncbi:MAG: hypothetical protein BWY65_01912 [Firmicutes bacterium ADurb.Bin373]|nr:MAG: hypothetical protein BWY65_01912 [Firmicutes bacterium ADurb.Bin373]
MIKEITMDNFITFGFSFLLNSAIALLIIRAIYYPVKRDKEYVLTFLTFNTLIFLIANLLQEVSVSIGVGLSMFAIFRMLRYRTDPIPIREMTYLFVMMALPFVNATLVAQENYAGLLIADAWILGTLQGKSAGEGKLQFLLLVGTAAVKGFFSLMTFRLAAANADEAARSGDTVYSGNARGAKIATLVCAAATFAVLAFGAKMAF